MTDHRSRRIPPQYCSRSISVNEDDNGGAACHIRANTIFLCRKKCRLNPK